MQLSDHDICTDIDAMEEIAKEVPLSRIARPAWDREVLGRTVRKTGKSRGRSLERGLERGGNGKLLFHADVSDNCRKIVENRARTRLLTEKKRAKIDQ